MEQINYLVRKYAEAMQAVKSININFIAEQVERFVEEKIIFIHRHMGIPHCVNFSFDTNFDDDFTLMVTVSAELDNEGCFEVAEIFLSLTNSGLMIQNIRMIGATNREVMGTEVIKQLWVVLEEGITNL